MTNTEDNSTIIGGEKKHKASIRINLFIKLNKTTRYFNWLFFQQQDWRASSVLLLIYSAIYKHKGIIYYNYKHKDILFSKRENIQTFFKADQRFERYSQSEFIFVYRQTQITRMYKTII